MSVSTLSNSAHHLLPHVTIFHRNQILTQSRFITIMAVQMMSLRECSEPDY